MFSIFGAGSFLEAFSTWKHKIIDKVCLYSYVFYCFMNFLCILLFYEFLMYFIVLWISYVFYCFFNFYVFYCFMISAVWDLHLDQYQAELMIYKAKRGQNYWFTGQNEKFTLPFVLYTKWKILTFRVDLWSQKVMWLRNGRSDFRKLGVKISARLQRKKSWSDVAESAAVLRVRHPPPPPSPPVQLGLMCTKTFWQEWTIFAFKMGI